MPCEETLREVGCFCLEKRWLQRHLRAAPPIQGRQEDGVMLCTVAHGGRVRDNRSKLEQERFSLATRKTFIPRRTAEQWVRLPREVVQSPFWEVSKT